MLRSSVILATLRATVEEAPMARFILILLLVSADRSGVVTIGQRAIAQEVHREPATVKYHLRRLRHIGAVCVLKRGGGRGVNRYQLTLHDTENAGAA